MSHATDGSPLVGHSVVEFAGIGPGPLACTMLADLGCEVVRVIRTESHGGALPDGLADIAVRGRTTIAIDLKSDEGRTVAQGLVNRSDVLLEAFRPGVMERLGLGPEVFMESNPGLVYARLTGWGQTGPYSSMAGHDINYISLSGALDAIGTADAPLPPLNLVGDYAGGSMFAVARITAALVARHRTGVGSVLDIAMVDGVEVLLSPVAEMAAMGAWVEERASNLLDGGAPFYRTYETSNGGFMAVGALEPVFYTAFVKGLGLDESDLPDRWDRSEWPVLSELFAKVFETQDRDHWQEVFDGTDACVTPVLKMSESKHHPHVASRSRTSIPDSPAPAAAREVLLASGLATTEIDELLKSGIISFP